MPTTTELLDFTALSSRAESVRFDVLDGQLLKIGEATPAQDQIPLVQIDTFRTQMRTMTNLRLIPSDTAAIDVRNDLIRPSWEFYNGALFPLGVFAFQNPVRGRHSWGVDSTNTLTDLAVLLDDPSAEATGAPRGRLITEFLAEYLTVNLATPFSITASQARFGQPAVWPPGTGRYQIVADCAKLLGYLAPYFDNHGHLILRPVPLIRTATPAFTYESGGTVEVDTITEASTLLTAPNRYVVIGGGFTSSDPVIGVFDVPSGAPNSAYNLGRVVTKTIQLQSVQDNVSAYAAARAAYFNDKIVDTAEFDAVTQPQHDIFDVVRYHGRNYLEVGATIALERGGTHHHVLRNVYD